MGCAAQWAYRRARKWGKNCVRNSGNATMHRSNFFWMNVKWRCSHLIKCVCARERVLRALSNGNEKSFLIPLTTQNIQVDLQEVDKLPFKEWTQRRVEVCSVVRGEVRRKKSINGKFTWFIQFQYHTKWLNICERDECTRKRLKRLRAGENPAITYIDDFPSAFIIVIVEHISRANCLR